MIKMTPPERIWVFPCAGCTMFAAEIEQVNTDTVEYIRADRIEGLEAKLEMATGALERIASGEFDGVMLLSLPPQDAARSYAARILAELKGDKE